MHIFFQQTFMDACMADASPTPMSKTREIAPDLPRAPVPQKVNLHHRPSPANRDLPISTSPPRTLAPAQLLSLKIETVGPRKSSGKMAPSHFARGQQNGERTAFLQHAVAEARAHTHALTQKGVSTSWYGEILCHNVSCVYQAQTCYLYRSLENA